MLTRHTYHDLQWIDLEQPTHEEVRALMEEFDIHPIVADELLSRSLRPKIDHYENFIYCILHFPAFRHTHEETVQEVDFVIGKKFLITVHYEALDPLHKFSKVFEVNSILNRANMGDHAGFLFFYMVRKIYASLRHELAIIADELKDVEDRIFLGEEREMLESLSRLNRDLLSFRRALSLHAPVLQSLHIASTEFFGKNFGHYIDNIIGEYHKVEEELTGEKEVLEDLRSTNNSLLTTKTNDVIKALTLLNAIILPASFVTWIFAVDAKDMPIRGMNGDFWVMSGIMVATSLAALLFLRMKKWL